MARNLELKAQGLVFFICNKSLSVVEWRVRAQGIGPMHVRSRPVILLFQYIGGSIQGFKCMGKGRGVGRFMVQDFWYTVQGM